VDIETLNDLREVLRETGYSSKAISEIVKWYNSENPAIGLNNLASTTLTYRFLVFQTGGDF